MKRDHIEFIHLSNIQPELRGLAGSDDPSANVRLLSLDLDNGASTEHVEFIETLQAPGGLFTSDLEIFVLEGKLKIGIYELEKHHYAFIPKGVCVGPWFAEKGTKILWMPSKELRYIASDLSKKDARSDLFIPQLDPNAMVWQPTETPGFPIGAMRKTLRVDKNSGQTTWLLGLLPQWREHRVETHPVSEEAFVLQGSLYSQAGHMGKDCYFWRPPHIPHGPFHSDEGILVFARTDGPLITHHSLPKDKS